MKRTTDVAKLRREFRKTELPWEEQVFLRILATLGLTAWCLLLWGHQFQPEELAPPEEEPVKVAKVRIQEPPEKEEPEPEPEPLPPRAETQEPKPEPEPEKAAEPKPEPKPEPKKRSVKSMGLLSALSSKKGRESDASQRIAEAPKDVDLRDTKEDLSEDVGSFTGTVGAREKASVEEMVAGLPRGSDREVVLDGDVVTPVEQPEGSSIESVDGGVSGRTFAEIRKVVAAHVAGLKYLYDKELKRNPSLGGKMTVEFVVTPPGRVANVRIVHSGLDHPELEHSIVSRIETWKFPSKDTEPTRVTFPFDFVRPAG